MLEILDPKSAVRVPPNRCALGIMTKAPQPGRVKTRLSPPLTPEEAAQLNACFLQDISLSISKACAESNGCGVAVYTPIGAEGVYEDILPGDFMLIPQRGDGFGDRLAFAAQDLFGAGFQSVCLINSDSPTVPVSSFIEACDELAKVGDRIVLGPSNDGGYYLIGLKNFHGRVFQEIDWSTERVFAQTEARAAEMDISVHRLPVGSDVDDATGLNRLCDELSKDDASPELALNTRRLLKEIVAHKGRERRWPQS